MNADRVLIGGEDTPEGQHAIKQLSWVYLQDARAGIPLALPGLQPLPRLRRPTPPARGPLLEMAGPHPPRPLPTPRLRAPHAPGTVSLNK